jgi:hypothetical protein
MRSGTCRTRMRCGESVVVSLLPPLTSIRTYSSRPRAGRSSVLEKLWDHTAAAARDANNLPDTAITRCQLPPLGYALVVTGQWCYS